MTRRYRITEVVAEVGVSEARILSFIEYGWISPADREKRELDEEDVARALLIRDLTQIFGVNDEAVPLVLHLIDQLYATRSRVARVAQVAQIAQIGR